MATGGESTDNSLYQRILREGKLCITSAKKLYIGLKCINSGQPCSVIEYDNPTNRRVLEFIVDFSLSDESDKDKIYLKILSPFSDPKKPSRLTSSIDWFNCTKDFVSIELLFMFILKSKFDNYSLFMSLCRQNLENIRWDTSDEDGNTMLHYVTVMTQYPEVACDVIRHIKVIPKYNNLVNKANSKGVVPLAFVLLRNIGLELTFLHSKTVIAHSGIINELINAKANILLKIDGSDSYVWKGGNEINFCTRKSDPTSILVSSRKITRKNENDARLCCSLKEVPVCELIDVNKLNELDRNISPNLLEQVIHFPCIQIIESLKLCKFDSPITKRGGTCVLHYVVQFCSEEVIKFIIEQIPNPQKGLLVTDGNRNSILHLSILRGDENIVRIIIESCRAILNEMLEAQNASNQTPLELILHRNMLNLIELIHKQVPAFITRKDTGNNTLFHKAIEKKNTELLRYLAAQQEMRDIVNERNTNGDTALMQCVRNRFVEGFVIILEIKECNSNVTDARGYSLLHLAIINYEKEIFSELLQDILVHILNGTNLINESIKVPTHPPSTSDKYAGLTPLLLSMKCGQFTAAKLLIEKGASIDTPDIQGNTFCFYLILHCHVDNELREFFSIQLKPNNFKNKQESSNITSISNDISLLYLCVKHLNRTAFTLLLPHCNIAMLAYQDKSLNTVLHLVLTNKKYTEFLRLIISRLVTLNHENAANKEIRNLINKKNYEEETPLLLSVYLGESEIVKQLINLGCDIPIIPSHLKSNILHIAAQYGDSEMVSHILSIIKDPQQLCEMASCHNPGEKTPLHIAIQRNQSGIVEALLGLKSDLRKQDNKTTTLLNYAIAHGDTMFKLVYDNLQLDTELLRSSVAIKRPSHCIIHSISHRNILALKTLISYNPEFLNLRHENLPLLHFAISKQFDTGVEYLLSRGSPLATRRADNSITLHTDRLKLNLVFSETQVGYKLKDGYVVTDMATLSTSEYHESILTVKNTVTLLTNLVSCETTEPIESYLKTSFHPKTDMSQLSTISSQYATLQVMTYLLRGNCPNFSFDWNSKGDSGNTIVHCGVYNPCIKAFILLLNCLHEYETSGVLSKTISYLGIRNKLIDGRNAKHCSALELAIRDNKSQAFDALVQNGASLETKDEKQNNIIHNFLLCRNSDTSYLDRILLELLKLSNDHINDNNSTGHTPLHTAVATGNIPAFKKISAVKSCKYDAVTSDGDNIVHLSIRSGKLDLLNEIIKVIAVHDEDKSGETKMLNAKNKTGLSPLFLAVELGNAQLMTQLSEYGAEGSGRNGGSILHYAIDNCSKIPNHPKMIEGIIFHQEDLLNSKDNSNETPLHYAIKTDKENILSLLLKCPALDLSCQSNTGMTALHFAVKKKLSIFENLLNAIEHRDQLSSILNVQDYQSKTALHHCIEFTNCNTNILDKLLSQDPDVRIVDINSNNVLHFAAMNSSRLKILVALLKHINSKCPDSLPALLSVQNNQHNTPLYCAIQGQNVAGIEELVKVNASLRVIRNNRTVTLCSSQTSPHTAVPMQLYSVRIPEKTELEISVGFKVSSNRWILSDLPHLSCTYLTPVNSSTSKSHAVCDLKVNEIILKTNLLTCMCCEPLQLVISDEIKKRYTNGAKLMHLAASFGSIQVVQYLMEFYGTNLQYFENDNRGYSVLHYSTENRNSEVLRSLLAHSKTHYPQEFTELSGKLLHFCIEIDSLDSFKILLEQQYGASANYTDANGDSLLHLIVLLKRKENYTRQLLECSQLISSEYCNWINKNGNTALHLAIADNQLDNLKEILKHNPDMSIMNSVQNTALHIAVEHSNINIITEVIKYISQLPNRLELINASNASPERNKPIHLATSIGVWNIVELLLSNGADLYSLNASGSTILHLAIQLDAMKDTEMTLNVLKYESENRSGNRQFIFLRDKQGCTPLHLAVKCRRVDCIKILLEEPVDLGITDIQRETVLHYAIRTEVDNVFDLIYQSIMKLPIQCCVVRSQVRRLFCIQNSAGSSPLHLSIELQYHHAVTELLSQSVCVDTRDKHGHTVMHYAARYQTDGSEILKQVITSTYNITINDIEDTSHTSCMLNSRDVLGRTPLLLAIENSKQLSVGALLDCKPDLLIKDHLGNGAIAYAVMRSNSIQILDTILHIIKSHFSNDKEYVGLINGQNKSGLSALHVAIYSDNFDGAQRIVKEGAKLVLDDPSNTICTVGMHGLLSKNIHLKTGGISTPRNDDESIIGYAFRSTSNVIYSTLPDLDNVNMITNKTDFEELVNTKAIVCDILRSTCTEILEAILKKNPNYVNEEFEHIPLLHLAAQFATLPIMQFLCGEKFHFKFEAKDSTRLEETVIHYSVLNPCSEAVDCLLDKVEQYEKENGITITIIDQTDSEDCSPLKKSINLKQWDNFMMLIKHGADFTKKDSNGTILHAMISKNDDSSSKSLECLIKAINQSKHISSVRKQRMFDTMHHGLTAVHLAVSLSNTTAAIQLINADVDLTNVNRGNGYTIVHTCVNRPESPANLLLLNVLCKAVAEHDFTQITKYKILHLRDQKGDTSLHLTIKGGKNAKMLEILLNNTAPFTVGDLHGNAALHLAAKNDLLSHVKTILFFIQNDARERGYGPSSRKERCIKEIMRKNNKKELPILLTKDKDILLCMLKFWDNETLLNLDLYRSGYLIHFAVFNQDRELVEAILESQSSTQRFEMLRSRDSENNSPLHIASEKDATVIGKMLIHYGVDVNIQSVRGTPIEVAIKCEGVKFASELINEGADIKRFVFLLANDLISEKRITRILDDGQMSIDDIYSSCDCSVIHYAARMSSTRRISFLLRKNANLCAKDRDGRGAVHHAISSRRDVTIIRAFLDEAYRLDINDAESPNLNSLLDFDYFRETPGMLAADLNNLNFFKVICTEKYKFYLDTFHYTDRQGNNLLHHLIRSNAMECIRFLIPYLASNFQEGFSQIMNGRNNLGLSPMGLARGIKQQETVDLIVQICDAEFFECCPDVVHRIADEEDNNTLSDILNKMVLCDAENAFISTKIMDSNDEGGYPNFRIFNYHLAPLWHKMYGSQTNRIKYHPLLKFTVDAKIKLYKWWYLLMLFLYLLFYIPMVSALLLASVKCDNSLFYYYSHLGILRFFLEIYIITVSILYMVNEAIEVYGKWKYLKNLPRTSRVLAYKPPNQINYYGLEKFEGLVFSSVHKLLIDIPHKLKYKLHMFDRKRTNYLLRTTFQHISTSYSLLEIASVVLLLLLFLFRLIIFYTIVPVISAAHWTLSSLTFIAFTFKFFKYTKIFPTLGIYIETIFQVLKKDVPRFMVIILLILVGYAGGAHLIARRFDGEVNNGHVQTSDQCSPSSWLGDDFNSVYSMLTPILSGLLFLVGGGPADYELELYHVHLIFSIFYFTFAFGIIVVLSNIFIAQLSQTYANIHSEKHLIDYKADLALQYEKQSNLAFIFEWFFSKALRRIMVESFTVSLTEWKSYLKFYSERIDSDSDLKFQDLKQSEENVGIKSDRDSNEANNADFNAANSELKKREEVMDSQLSKLQLLITQIQLNTQAGDAQPHQAQEEKTKVDSPKPDKLRTS